ncbi:uncharacterized protein CIMG_11443 [Coccidioides immitis RS]|uniref:Uncharacterized protein n=1 Tax=Coccidioides immitis (strain RS) TaxID=246410 RepID=A0A0D8JUR4_COCIM|nr:uncharacterized protein CIMG_11443 [Coccidioides immitis RS]KJF61075.1 hypothetical protein CIMG_11443 [Coccidioides immitis RS]
MPPIYLFLALALLLGLWGTREDGGRGDIQPGPQDQHTPSYPSTNRTRTPGWLSEPLRVQRPRSEHSMYATMIFAFRGQDHPVFAAQHRPSELAGMTTSARQRTSSYGGRQLTVIDCDHRSAQAGNPVAVLASAIPRQG